MRILVVEDETPARRRLMELLRKVLPEPLEIQEADSVRSTLEILAPGPDPDLLFLDVELADGSSLPVLQKVQPTCPIIVTSAYDKYALDAYRLQSVDYLLKPIDEQKLRGALDKVNQLRDYFRKHPLPGEETVEAEGPYRKRLLLHTPTGFTVVNIADVAYFYTEHKAVFLREKSGRTLLVNLSLDELTQILDPTRFFRANRQYILSLEAIARIENMPRSRLALHLAPQVAEPPIVSQETTPLFKKWVAR
jgi:DNA-binding LytR/AlgR family response regulator